MDVGALKYWYKYWICFWYLKKALVRVCELGLSIECIASTIINIPHQRGTFVRIDEPTLTHHCHLESIVYFRVHSWCCIFYGFGQICNNSICHCSIQSSFTALKILYALLIHSSLPLSPGNYWSFYCLHSFASSRLSYSWNHIVCGLVFFHLVIYI